MKRILGIALVALFLVLLAGYYPFSEDNEKPPTVDQVLSRINSYQSFCWGIEGGSQRIYFFNVRAREIRGCIDYANDSAVWWVKRADGGNFTYRASPQTNDMDWSVAVHTVWPEMNIMNFLRWVLKNGNVTGIQKEDSYYRFRVIFKREEVSNAGTIEDPHIIRVVETWNVTLRVRGKGEPLGGHFYGEINGGSAGVPSVHEGNFTILTAHS